MLSLTISQVEEIVRAFALWSIFGPLVALVVYSAICTLLGLVGEWLDRRSFRALWQEKYGDRVDGFEEAFWNYREGQPTSLM